MLQAEARFFVVKGSSSGGGGLSLVYSCPDSAPIRQKMTYSTAKATVVAAINSLGLTLDKVTEIRQVRRSKCELPSASAHIRPLSRNACHPREGTGGAGEMYLAGLNGGGRGDMYGRRGRAARLPLATSTALC